MSKNHQSIPPGQWRQMRLSTMNRDGYACVICGSRAKLECDHKVPLSEGGTNDPDNLQILCKPCHIAKTRKESGVKDHPDSLDWMAFAAGSRVERRRMLEKASKQVHTRTVQKDA